MHGISRRFMISCIAVIVAVQLVLASPSRAANGTNGFNDEYVYATTRSVSEMDANPALKLTLFPVTIVLDTALLQFAVIAGFVA
jgi:uncharacterized protein YceK